MRLSPTTTVHDRFGTTISARIDFEELDEATFEPRFQVPPGWLLDETSSPFVPFAVAVAAWFGEPLTVDGPVRAEVLASARAAAPLLSSFARRPPIEVAARTTVASPRRPAGGRRTGLFVSRGVDSSVCMVLADRGELHPRPDLGIIVSGIEPFRTADDAEAAIEQSVEAAAAFGLEPLVVRTNLWDQTHPRITYVNVHGSALFGLAHALAHHLADIVIASAVGRHTPPLGSHPELDHLWGNDELGVHLLPEGMERSERVRVLAEDGRALRWLRVCWLEPDRNCGRCRKCIMTAALLDRYGALERTPTFQREPVWPEELRRHPPGNEFLADVMDSVPDDLANAAALSQDRYADPWQWQPEVVRLRACLAADPAGSRRTVPWALVGPAGDAGAAGRAVDAMTTAFGPGVVWTDDEQLARPILEQVLARSERLLWAGPADAIDLERVVIALEHGCRPVQVVEQGAPELTASLPAPLRTVVRAPHELPSLVDEPPELVRELAIAVATGGAGWMRSEHEHT